MPTRVRFRLNKVTGDIEEFLVDDQDRTLSEAEHDRIATDVGRVIARQPRLSEVLPSRPAPASARNETAEDPPQAERTPPVRSTDN